MKIGWIGLGIRGTPMARNLRRGGMELFVNDVSEAAVQRLTAEGARAASRAEIGAACEIIALMLPSGPISRDVIAGADGLVRHVRPGTLVIDFSSVTPEDSRFCQERLAEAGASFLDAPVSGGEEGAVNGSLAIMVGGAEVDFLRAEPVMKLLGSKATLVGPVGSGSVTKLANQVIVNLTIAAVSEALVLAKKSGAEPERVFEAIRTGLAGSRVLEDKAPRMIRGEFAPGGRISINHKDMKNVLAAAHAADVPVPLSAQLFEMMQALKVDGQFGEDHSAIVRYYEKLAGIPSL